jgi:hypothetical protein
VYAKIVIDLLVLLDEIVAILVEIVNSIALHPTEHLLLYLKTNEKLSN